MRHTSQVQPRVCYKRQLEALLDLLSDDDPAIMTMTEFATQRLVELSDNARIVPQGQTAARVY